MIYVLKQIQPVSNRNTKRVGVYIIEYLRFHHCRNDEETKILINNLINTEAAVFRSKSCYSFKLNLKRRFLNVLSSPWCLISITGAIFSVIPIMLHEYCTKY